MNPGDHVELVSMPNASDPIAPGTRGRVRAVIHAGGFIQCDVVWDNGRELMLSIPPDEVLVI